MAKKTKKEIRVTNRQKYGRRLQGLLSRSGFPTILAFANACELPYSVVYKFHVGRSNPSLSTLESMASALGMPVDLFLRNLSSD